MKLGIMQPYIFPYIGYFQLIKCVDKFILYNDVNFIKQGWINRNYILLGKQKYLFTIPVNNISSYSFIKDTQLNNYAAWHKKFLKTIEQAYRKAPYFSEIYQLLEDILIVEPGGISDLIERSLVKICNYIDIDTIICSSSSVYNNVQLKAEERIIDICKQENASQYINAIGGIELYNKNNFQIEGKELLFLKPGEISYNQFDNEHVHNLSIIDVLMFNDKLQISSFLDAYDLI